MRYRLRTLLIALGVVPPILAGVWFIVQWQLGWLTLTALACFLASLWLHGPPGRLRSAFSPRRVFALLLGLFAILLAIGVADALFVEYFRSFHATVVP